MTAAPGPQQPEEVRVSMSMAHAMQAGALAAFAQRLEDAGHVAASVMADELAGFYRQWSKDPTTIPAVPSARPDDRCSVCLASSGGSCVYRYGVHCVHGRTFAQPDDRLVESGWGGADPCGGPGCTHPHGDLYCTPAQPVRDTEEGRR